MDGIKLLGFIACLPPGRRVIFVTAFFQIFQGYTLAVPYCLN